MTQSPPAGFTRREVLVTEALLLVTVMIWGVNFSALKYGTQHLAPLAYNGVRMTVGAIALLAVTLRSNERRPSTGDIVRLMLLGVLGHGLYQAFFIYGIASTRAGTASLVVSASPALIAIVGRALGVERVSARAVMGIALSIAGIAFVIFGSATAPGGESGVKGDLLILCSVVCWAFYTHGLTPLLKRVHGVQIAAWTLVGGTIPILAFALPSIVRTDWMGAPALVFAAIAYSGFGAMAIAYIFWYRGVRVIGPTRSAMFSNLQPIVAVLVSWPLLGEVPTAWQGVGAAGVLGGLLLTRDHSAAEPAHGE
ncbi:MAG: DMT family transporter [Gemmatimonadetes bacterium]|nr:DMT family transporter [Gemmatimonadota bacterium]MBI3567733.1 DMT family transporter [Gemmatimonadota bacterium]